MWFDLLVLYCHLQEIRVALSDSSRKSSATHFCYSLCSIFVCPNNGMTVIVWNFESVHRFWCVQFHTGVYGHCQSLLWKLTLARKIHCGTGDSNPRQYCAYLLSQTLYRMRFPMDVSITVQHNTLFVFLLRIMSSAPWGKWCWFALYQ